MAIGDQPWLDLTAGMPPQAQAAADLVRSMRDGDRY